MYVLPLRSGGGSSCVAVRRPILKRVDRMIVVRLHTRIRFPLMCGSLIIRPGIKFLQDESDGDQ